MARRATGTALVLMTCTVASTAIFGVSAAGALSPASPNAPAHVYVFAGFLGFQTRLQGAVDKIERRNIAVTVGQSFERSSMAESAIEAYRAGKVRSVIIVGYSLGGGAALKMAAELDDAQVPVELIVTVEPIDVSDVRANVRRVVNYYLPNGWGSELRATKDFRGSLRNIAERNPALDHFELVEAREDDVVDQVLSAVATPSTAPSARSRR